MRVANVHLDEPLFWQCWKLDSPIVKTIIDTVAHAAAQLGRIEK
jgi:LysR family transcriptional regulator (chromosome initiation inhibitor)